MNLPDEMDIPDALSACYKRTLRVETPNGGSGSAFVMRYREREWLVTAGHIADKFGNGEIDAFDQNGHKLSGLGKRLPKSARSHKDVAVFRFLPEHPDFGRPLAPYIGKNIHLSQDAYFMGFPYLGPGLRPADPNTPLTKRAIISGQAKDDEDTDVWLLDGMNTGGFSGGPLIAEWSEGFRVFAVVSAYVRKKDEDGDEMRLNEDDAPTSSGFIQANSVLVVGFSIRHAVEAIDDRLGSRPPE